MNTKQTLMAALVAVACATSAQAQCLSDAQAAELVASYVAKTPAANVEGLSDADGACTRAKVNALLAQRLGKVVGYKAGLTNPAVQSALTPTSRCGASCTKAWCWPMALPWMPPWRPPVV